MITTLYLFGPEPTNTASITLFYSNGSSKTVPEVNYALLIPADKTAYDAFRDMWSADRHIIFTNLPIGIDGDITVPGAVNPSGKQDIDYNTLSINDKTKIDNFVALIEKLFV